MANKLYEETAIQDIANAIREKNSGTDTYTVAQMGAAIRDISSGGEQPIRYYTGTITDTTVGSGKYKTLVTDSDLAAHRNDETLWCRVIFDIEPTPYTIVENLGFNSANPVSGTQFQVTRRWDSNSADSRGSVGVPINTDSPISVGCVQITADGEFRIYSNSNTNFAIRPCDFTVIVGWQGE